MVRSTCVVLLVCSCFLTPRLFAQHFRLVTDEAGLAGAQNSNGVAVADYDLDGDLDVYLVARQQYHPDQEDTWNRLFRNNSDGTFTDVTLEAGVLSRVSGFARGQMGNKFGAAWGDFDNDGDPDLFLTQIGPDILYRNEGNGTFEDVTAAAGVAGTDDNANHASALWWDYDLDADLDLYLSNWGGGNTFYENQGNGTFEDITDRSGLGDLGQTWTSIPIDANRDGLPDLYVVNDFGANRFYLNTSDKTFIEATAQFGLEDEGHGMGVAIGDCNNDGAFDIYLTNDAAYYPNPLFTAGAQGAFTEEGQALGVSNAEWAWGTEFLDYDHDGDLDLYVVNGFPIDHGNNYLFANQLVEQGQPTFEDRSAASGADGEPDARGLAVFDYNDDGKLDLLVANWDGVPYLYRNETEAENWLLIELTGTASNRDALGATISVTAGGRTVHRHHDGVDFLGQSIKPLHVGLGPASLAETVVVRWPSGLEDILHDVPVNQRLQIIEGQSTATPVDEPPETVTRFALLGNGPNPFHRTTAITFTVPQAGTVELTVYNMLGQEVLARRAAYAAPGQYSLDVEGAGLLSSSGIYLYRLVMGNEARVGTMVYLP